MARIKNFRLQKVLEFKEHLETMGMLELHKAQSKQIDAEQTLHHLENSKEHLLQQAEEQFKNQQRINLNDLRFHFGYLDQLQHSIASQNKAIQDLKNVVEQKRNQLNRAVKERKIIQTLKDQFDNRQKQEVKKAENETIDEIAIRKPQNNQEAGE